MASNKQKLKPKPSFYMTNNLLAKSNKLTFFIIMYSRTNVASLHYIYIHMKLFNGNQILGPCRVGIRLQEPSLTFQCKMNHLVSTIKPVRETRGKKVQRFETN